AIDTAHAFVVHPAPEESREFKILLAHLSVRIKLFGLIHNRKQMMIPETVAGLNIAGEFRAAGMTRGAGFKHLFACESVNRGIGSFASAIRVLPIVVRLHRAVAGFAPDSIFHIARAETIG